MFTGIVESLGTITGVEPRGAGRRLHITAADVAPRLSVGDSVAVDGCCLTVTATDSEGWSVDAVPETLQRTTLGRRGIGDRVNLELPLAADGRFGGHVVQGHIDGVGSVVGISSLDDGSHLVEFELPDGLERHLVEKGSVAVDGVSLTVAAVTGDRFTVAVIPHTWKVTRFGGYGEGTAVNVEVDILAKYVERLLDARHAGEGAA